MKEYDVRTDKEFFEKIIALKFDVQLMASLFQNEGSITNEEEIKEWSIHIHKMTDKLERFRKEGYARFDLRE